MSMILVVLVGVIGGLAGAIQGQLLGIMEDKAGTLISTFITYAGGGLAATLVVLAVGGARLSDLKDVPWWAYTAGLAGLVVVSSLGITVSSMGLGAGLTLFTGASIAIGALIDNLGLFGDSHPLDARRLGGIALVIVGTWLVVGTDAVIAS